MALRLFGGRRVFGVPLSALLALLALAGIGLAMGGRGVAQRLASSSPALPPGEAAQRLLAIGDLDGAVEAARGLPSDDPRAAAIMGAAEIARGRYAEAERVLEPAAKTAPVSDAALELGLLRSRLGRRAEAEPLLERQLEGDGTPAGLLRAGLAARTLGLFEDANRFFREAVDAAPNSPAPNTAWGDLFLEKYNKPDAVRSYEAALAADRDWVPAHLGLARALVDENPPAARAALEKVLAIDPDRVEARLLLAEIALDEGDEEEAREAIEAALAANPKSLEAHALLAAMAYLDDRADAFEQHVRDTLAINPVYGEVYRVAGDHASRNYRFDEAVVLTRRALELDPANDRALADLGKHLLRTGDEISAREALDRAFERDPYDVVTYNLLGMFDALEKFETFEEGNLVVRLHPDEAAVMKEYVLPLAREALSTLGERYGVQPKGPILLEIFPKHDDFAVRNVGLPGLIGALGACFGRVVTMDSPRARPPGTFNWGATLWHEMAHVITLHLSNQRAPRWLSEGLSVYEEQRARPDWGREMEVTFAGALNEGKVLPLEELNAGFTRPDTIALSYYQAAVLVEHLIALHGEPAIHEMLRAYGRGLDTDEVLRTVLDTDFRTLQKSFDAALDSRFGALRTALAKPPGLSTGHTAEQLARVAELNPHSYAVHLALGRALHAAGDTDAALKALERAAQLVPMATGKESPRALMAEIAESRGDRARALAELEALVSRDHTDVDAARRLAALARDAEDEARLWTAYSRIVEIDPFDPDAHRELGRLALARGELPVAIRELRVALATNPVDRAAAHCDLAEAYLQTGHLAGAKAAVLAALEIAPSYERAQDLLLRVAEGQP